MERKYNVYESWNRSGSNLENQRPEKVEEGGHRPTNCSDGHKRDEGQKVGRDRTVRGQSKKIRCRSVKVTGGIEQ